MSIKNSRIGKRELCVFLDVETNTAGYELALASGWSRQSLLAHAINAYMTHLSLPARLDASCKRMVAVPSRKRSVRQSRGRIGKMGLAGWFADSAIHAVQCQLFSKGVNCQIAGEEGVRLLLQEHPVPHQIEQEPAIALQDAAPLPESDIRPEGQQQETHTDQEPEWVSSLHETSEMPDF